MRWSSWRRRVACALALGFVTPRAIAADGEREIASAFFVSKTQNRNQVHYAVKVDSRCRPVAPIPVRPYWRMLEKSPNATEPLLDREQPAYGIARQDVDGENVRLSLRAIPARPVVIQTWRTSNGDCESAAITTIDGGRARLYSVHVVLRMFGVAYLVMTGWKDDGSVVHERVEM